MNFKCQKLDPTHSSLSLLFPSAGFSPHLVSSYSTWRSGSAPSQTNANSMIGQKILRSCICAPIKNNPLRNVLIQMIRVSTFRKIFNFTIKFGPQIFNLGMKFANLSINKILTLTINKISCLKKRFLNNHSVNKKLKQLLTSFHDLRIVSVIRWEVGRHTFL